jgi:hypothetical protein
MSASLVDNMSATNFSIVAACWLALKRITEGGLRMVVQPLLKMIDDFTDIK